MAIEFACPTCGTVIKAPVEYAGKVAKCKKCQARITIPLPQQPERAIELIPPKTNFLSDRHEHLIKMGFPPTIHGIPIAQFSDQDAKALCAWGSQMIDLFKCEEGIIEEIKYDGHILVMEDGTRWEVDDTDTYTATLWDAGDHIVVFDGRMFKLDDSESVAVEKED